MFFAWLKKKKLISFSERLIITQAHKVESKIKLGTFFGLVREIKKTKKCQRFSIGLLGYTENFKSDTLRAFPEHIEPKVLSESYKHTFAVSGLT